MGGRQLIKITFIITRADDLGGAQVHVRDLAAALKERGGDVTVLAGGGGILFDALADRGVRCRKLEKLVHPISPLQDWAAFREIRAALHEYKPDLVTTHSNKAGLLGRLAAKSLNIPVVHTSHGFLFSANPQSPGGLFYRLMEKIAAQLSDLVITVAHSEYETAKRLRVIDPSKMVVVHNGLPEPGESFRAGADAAVEAPRLVMVARFAEPKDHLTLLRALNGLLHAPWSLSLVGDGAGRRPMEEIAGELGIRERVDFLGVREDVDAILAVSQVFVLSSWREGFPLSVLEAMRAGLPVVATNVGGIGEAVEEGKTGFLVPPGNSEALKDKLNRLIGDPVLRQSMGEAGRKRFIEKFTLEEMVDKTLKVYRGVLDARANAWL